MLTKADIDWLKSELSLVFATKDEFRKYTDKVLERLDAFIGEIKARREEQTIHSEEHRSIHDQLDKLEKRISIYP